MITKLHDKELKVASGKLRAVKQTKRMWEHILITIEDVGPMREDPLNLIRMKRIYCEKNDVEWLYNCPLCEVVIGRDKYAGNVLCGECPLIECWNRDPNELCTVSDMPCCNRFSPYKKVNNYLTDDNQREAIRECLVIIHACKMYIKRVGLARSDWGAYKKWRNNRYKKQII